MRARVNKILSSLGRPTDSISDEEIESFCKNAAYIEVVRYRSLQEEYISDQKKEDISNSLGFLDALFQLVHSTSFLTTVYCTGRWTRDAEDSIAYYVLFRAMDRFYETFKRYPGMNLSSMQGICSSHFYISG